MARAPHQPDAPSARPGVLVAEADLSVSEIQDLAEQVVELKQAAAGRPVRLHARVEAGDGKEIPAETAVSRREALAPVAKAPDSR